jgi:hypothetical protein
MENYQDYAELAYDDLEYDRPDEELSDEFESMIEIAVDFSDGR